MLFNQNKENAVQILELYEYHGRESVTTLPGTAIDFGSKIILDKGGKPQDIESFKKGVIDQNNILIAESQIAFDTVGSIDLPIPPNFVQNLALGYVSSNVYRALIGIRNYTEPSDGNDLSKLLEFIKSNFSSENLENLRNYDVLNRLLLLSIKSGRKKMFEVLPESDILIGTLKVLRDGDSVLKLPSDYN